MYNLKDAAAALIKYVKEIENCPLNKRGQKDGNKQHGIEKRCLNALERAGMTRNEALSVMREAIQ